MEKYGAKRARKIRRHTSPRTGGELEGRSERPDVATRRRDAQRRRNGTRCCCGLPVEIDLAKQHEILSLERRVDALKQAEQRHKEEAHAIRESLGASRAGGLVGGRSVQRDGDEAQAGSGVVPRPSKE
jgi:hypothetical protein